MWEYIQRKMIKKLIKTNMIKKNTEALPEDWMVTSEATNEVH